MSQDITNQGPMDPMIMFLERVMRDPVFPIEKAQAAMQLAVEQQKRVAERAFVFDLNAMQMELTPVGHVVRASGIQPPADFPGAGFEIPAHATVSLLVDQSHLTTAYPELTVSGGAASKIRLTYAEALVDSKGVKGNRNEIEGIAPNVAVDWMTLTPAASAAMLRGLFAKPS